MATEPRIVQMPEPTIRQTVKSPDWIETYKEGGPAEPQSFSVFNQRDQILTLKFYPLATRMFKGLKIKTVEGNKFVGQHDNDEAEFLSIHKLGPLTAEAFLNDFVGENVFQNPRCFLEEMQPHIWYLNVLPSKNSNREVAYNERVQKDKVCGFHAHDWHGLPTTFFIKEGIVVVAYRNSEAFGLDLSSIIYENRG